MAKDVKIVYREKKSKKRKGSHKKASIVHKAAALMADGLIAGPVLLPAVEMVQYAMASPQDHAGILNKFTEGAIGYNSVNNLVDTPQVMAVIVRDAIMIGGGLALKIYVVRRIR